MSVIQLPLHLLNVTVGLSQGLILTSVYVIQRPLLLPLSERNARVKNTGKLVNFTPNKKKPSRYWQVPVPDASDRLVDYTNYTIER